VGYVNNILLKDGIDLNLPYDVDKFFTAPIINFHDKYVEVDATPNFKSLEELDIDDPISAEKLSEMFDERKYKKVFSYINEESLLNDPKLKE